MRMFLTCKVDDEFKQVKQITPKTRLDIINYN